MSRRLSMLYASAVTALPPAVSTRIAPPQMVCGTSPRRCKIINAPTIATTCVGGISKDRAVGDVQRSGKDNRAALTARCIVGKGCCW